VAAPVSSPQVALPQAQPPMGPRPFAVPPARVNPRADLLLLQVPAQPVTPVLRQVAPVRSPPAAVQIVSMRPLEQRRE
jgi:hypothetical protein